jgi:DNA-binding HxlR family transcriptional regulator
MGLGKDYVGQACGLARALEVVGERWTMLVVRDAFYGVRRYSDFLSHLGLPRAVLADRLAGLVESGVLDKQRYQVSPARDEYVLTDAGLELWPVLHALSRWGGNHLAPEGAFRTFHHVACGTRLDADAACPSCGLTPAVPDVEIRPGPAADLARVDPVSVALRTPHRLLEPLDPVAA